MDTYKMKEDQNALEKSVLELRHIKEVMDIRIKSLHDEEMKYLQEIPAFKEQFEGEKRNIELLNIKNENIKSEINKANEELRRINSLISEGNKKLNDLTSYHNNIDVECLDIRADALRRHSDSKSRELAVQDREKKCDSKELYLIDRESSIDKSEFELRRKQTSFDEVNEKLNKLVNKNTIDIERHENNVQLLNESKKYHDQDKELLKDKLQNVDKIIKDNSDIKSSLLLQADKLSKEIEICKQKQSSLDRNIADLVNQENLLKIKDLKIRKMAHDAGLQKELKELEESLR